MNTEHSTRMEAVPFKSNEFLVAVLVLNLSVMTNNCI